MKYEEVVSCRPLLLGKSKPAPREPAPELSLLTLDPEAGPRKIVYLEWTMTRNACFRGRSRVSGLVPPRFLSLAAEIDRRGAEMPCTPLQAVLA